MKLAIITPFFLPVPSVKGGAVEQIITYFIYANEKYHFYDIDLYTMSSDKLDEYSFKYTNIIQIKNMQEHVLIKIYYMFNNILLHLLGRGKSKSYIGYRIRNVYKKNFYDITLVENNMDLYNSLIKEKKNEKFIFHLHNDFNNGDAGKTLFKTKNIINTADKIIVVSNYLKKKLQKIGAENVSVVYNVFLSRRFETVSEEKIQRFKSRLNIPTNKTIFTFIGRLTPDKGAKELLESLHLLKNKENIYCLIIGDNLYEGNMHNKYKNKLAKLAGSSGISVRFMGYMENKDLPIIYSSSDCIVIPSQVEEAFGVVALEAMAMGKPVIASNVGGLPEVLSQKGSILINNNDQFVEKFAEAIDIISSKKLLRKKMGKANFEKSKIFPNNEFKYYKELAKELV
ncbi:glycosyltransferase family 4 protein [Limosilactobacillus urinaemulieris]|uniref:glycosyltransferase family 4 protein n=1 Tax=Limosilactobacillus urinaemulieris TaxID=2742600 RepID=UPI001F597DBC|nr:glycosyltransferase family 4 protein [Limosilactobacillus urinaemulieris]